MAKKRKNKRDLYTTAGRVDMRSGGRVKLWHGARPNPRFQRGASEAYDSYHVQYPTRADYERAIAGNNTGGNQPTTNSLSAKQPISEEKQARLDETANLIGQTVQGTVPEAAVIPGISEEKGTAVSSDIRQATTTMAAPTSVTATQAAPVAPEQVTTVQDTAQISQPQPIQAAQMTAATIDPTAQVTAAQGRLSDDAVAQAAGVNRVATIDAAEVNIPEGALTERVVGTLSEEAKSTAAVNAGSSLARISRARQQLSNAGLSASEINQLGNDPTVLEARLANFDESQRGLIAGLPQEALVSTQLDSLLTGIESGNIPAFARPAVAQVEQMLASRGLEASTVGRDALVNAIIQSAIPIAQSNAQALQTSIAQQRGIEAQEAEANAARLQQTALKNADNVFRFDLAQFSADQQTALANSKFLQTVGLSEATMEQQGVVQDAILMSQANIAEANFNQAAQIQNAKAFLQMDLTNLANNQQANVLQAQQNQQRILSNQAAQNAAAQFNATSQNQTNQFMAGLQTQANQFNASQLNAMKQFNTTQTNAAAARDAQRQADLNRFNAQLATQVDQFNSQQDFARNQWNAQNAAVVEASNVQWRRQANTINTAAQNQINMSNAMNAFNLSSQSLSFLWQELRDQADFDFRSVENSRAQITQLQATAIANEGALAEKSNSTTRDLINLVKSITTNYYGSTDIPVPDDDDDDEGDE
tara:strand:+ start:255 stop:2372 length:2118 start_codon:yes stop_codon:yes gene_type:complete